MMSMNLTINGEQMQTDATTVAELLNERGLGKQPVAVEINRQVVPKREHATRNLQDGDTIEMVTLVGGG